MRYNPRTEQAETLESISDQCWTAVENAYWDRGNPSWVERRSCAQRVWNPETLAFDKWQWISLPTAYCPHLA